MQKMCKALLFNPLKSAFVTKNKNKKYKKIICYNAQIFQILIVNSAHVIDLILVGHGISRKRNRKN